jgi:hypothetical protein
MTNNPRTKRLDIRLNIEEYEAIEQKAKKNNLPITTYAREKLFYDIPHLEKHSFEYKALKGISYMVGAIRVMTQDQKEEVIKEVRVIMEKNGIEE